MGRKEKGITTFINTEAVQVQGIFSLSLSKLFLGATAIRVYLHLNLLQGGNLHQHLPAAVEGSRQFTLSKSLGLVIRGHLAAKTAVSQLT